MSKTIHEMNKEPLIVEDEGETSSSAAPTMNMEDFLNTNLFKERKRIDPETSSGSSKVKRLKTINADSDYTTGNETKSMINKPGSRRDQEPSTSHIKNLNMGGGRGDVTLQHPWIQRWCKKKVSETHDEPEEGEKVNQKQFPSIAAIALMGKAQSLTPTCLKKTNSLFVWNSQDLR